MYIYSITGVDKDRTRLLGLFFELEKAQNVVLLNPRAIFEHRNYLVVIEKLSEGLNGLTEDSWWYEWENDRYVQCETPQEYKYTTNFAMG